jgi:hypothetical protein
LGPRSIIRSQRSLVLLRLGLAAAALIGFAACRGGSDAAPARVCETLTGTPWTPSVGGEAHDDATVAAYTQEFTAGGAKILRLDEGYSDSSGHVMTFSNIDMDIDLLAEGSLSLVAEVQGFPSALVGGAWPVLVSLSDGVNEWVNLGGCDASGFYSCSGSSCSARAGCAPDPAGSLGSTYLGADANARRAKWESANRVGQPDDYVSVNTFPTCNWTSAGAGEPKCSFAMSPGNFFVSGKLRAGAGVKYTAKYVLLASNYTVSTGAWPYTAGLKLTVVRKKDGGAGTGRGTVDLNVILVGTDNIKASRTDKGKQNLDALLEHVRNHYAVENSGTTDIRLGEVNVYEWGCANDGDTFSRVHVDDAGAMFAQGSSLVDPASEGKALNIFLVTSIDYDGAGTILGLSGGIGGAMIHGTTSSGLVFSSLNKLDRYNPGCSGSGSCPISSQDRAFINMGGTISHEMGHFLGLNHLSEGQATSHDRLPDTPQCAIPDASGYLTVSSCRLESACSSVCSSTQYANTPFCADKSACQFNHVMWWTTKNYDSQGRGDGNIFSTQSGQILNYSPYVR